MMTPLSRMILGSCRLAVVATVGLVPAARADVPPPVVAARRILADRVLACTVGIRSKADAYSANSGSGIVVSPDGHVLTATSVVPIGAREIEVLFPGFVARDAVIVAADEKLAVTLLKVDARDLPCLPLSGALPEVGATVYTAGDVEGSMRTSGRASLSRGIVSGIYDVPACPEADYAGVAIETTAAVNPGSDGGPLVDASGAVCGVITLGVLPLRWQGTAVPTTVLLERFPALGSGGVVSPVTVVPPAAGEAPLRTVAGRLARFLVGIEVERKFPPEMLPLTSWRQYRDGIADFTELSESDQERRFIEWLVVSRALEVNQLLRRPAAPLTGVIVSAEGHVLTSLFNVGDDTAFVRKKNGRPRTWDVRELVGKAAVEADKDLVAGANPVRKLTVVLPDGGRKEATEVARHEPLGVALLKIDAADLPFLDLAAAASPQLGDEVGVLGRVAEGRTAWTLNAGIVSAPARNRGFRFQTDALLNYGNSGGPVFDRACNLLGVAAAPIEPDTLLGRLVNSRELMAWTRAPNSGVGLVARADRIRDALEALKGGTSFARIPGPVLGVDADEKKAFTALVVIARVAPQSPADRAGLVKGDTILEFNGVELRSWPDLVDRIASCKPGERVELLVQRKSAGPRLVIAGRDVETAEDFERFKRSLQPGETFTGALSVDDTRTVTVELGESR